MSEQQNNDKEAFEAFLKKHSEVSDTYARLGDLEPSAQLDEDILAASRRAVQARPQSVSSSFYRRWKTPLSMAASVVLCVALVSHYYKQSDERQTSLMTVPTESSLADSPQAERQDVVAEDIAAADAAVTAGKSSASLSRDMAASPQTRADADRANLIAEQKKTESARRSEADASEEQRTARRRPVESEAFFAEHHTTDESFKREPVGASRKDSQLESKVPPAPSVMHQYETPEDRQDVLPKQELLREKRRPAAPSAKELAGAAMIQPPAPAAALKVQPDRYYIKQDRSSSSTDQLDKRQLQFAKRLLLKISAYRARGYFQQADKLLRQFHHRYPNFPATEREQLLDSVAPLVPHGAH